MPLHILAIHYIGLTVGEMFDLGALADDCAADQSYDFLFAGQPLAVGCGVGSPVNPIAVK